LRERISWSSQSRSSIGRAGAVLAGGESAKSGFSLLPLGDTHGPTNQSWIPSIGRFRILDVFSMVSTKAKIAVRREP
jgi:hypothetical protein